MSKEKAGPAVGAPAPTFSGATQTGETLQLTDFQGQKVALYFYPKDDTPGCTKQACNLRDHWSELQAVGIAVIGVSADDELSHERFADKFALPFPLVADTDHSISEAYGVWGKKTLFGRQIMGIKRTTFLIDEQGQIHHIFRKPNVTGHTEEIMAQFGLTV